MDFQINDLIFGKVKGYPHWPAQIINIDKETYKHVTKFEVKFFATNEIAKLNKNDICSYNENKLKYSLESVASKHRELYGLALSEIAHRWANNKLSNTGMSPTEPKKIKNSFDFQKFIKKGQCNKLNTYFSSICWNK
jgi:hypothetical protein